MQKFCPECDRRFDPEVDQCPDDQTQLLPVLANPAIGRLLGGKYEIVECIGEGGMGAVYKAHDLPLDRWVAIKLLHPQKTTDASALRRFQQEAKAAVTLAHPNLVLLREFGIDDQTQEPYLVMDYVEGRTLADIIAKDSPLAWTFVKDMFKQVCAGLYYAHTQHVIHRDIKPGNIMIQRSDNSVKIVDFGIAKVIGETSSKLTATGEVFGSPLYMSPEQCRGETVDYRSDIYSVGVVLFESLCGEPPIAGGNQLETIHRKLSERPPAISALRGDLPPGIDAVMDRAMTSRPQDRYQSIANLSDDLDLLERTTLLPLTTPSPKPMVLKLLSNGKTWAVTAGYSAVVFLFVLIMAAIDRTNLVFAMAAMLSFLVFVTTLVANVYVRLKNLDPQTPLLETPKLLQERHRLLELQLHPDPLDTSYIGLGESLGTSGTGLGIGLGLGEFEIYRSVVLTEKARTRSPHIAVFGNPGSGKTSLLAGWLGREMHLRRRNLFVISTASDLTRLAIASQNAPEDHSFLSIGTKDGCTPLNPFCIDASGELFAAACRRAFRFSKGDASHWTENTAKLASACAKLLANAQLGINDLSVFLIDDAFQNQVLQQASRVPAVQDVINLVQNMKETPSVWEAATKPLLEFVEPALTHPHYVKAYTTGAEAFDMRAAIISRKPISLEITPDDTAAGALLANIAIASYLAAFEQVSNDSDDQRKCSIYMDCLDEFADLEMLEKIRDRTQQLGVELIAAISRPSRLPGKVRQFLLKHAGHICTFAVEPQCARWLGEHIFNAGGSSESQPEGLRNIELLSTLPKQSYIFAVNHEPAGVFQLNAPTMKEPPKLIASAE